VKPRAIDVATLEPARQAKLTPMIIMTMTKMKNPTNNKVNVPKMSPNISKTKSQFTPFRGCLKSLSDWGLFTFCERKFQENGVDSSSELIKD
jgi:hypothetical protein